MFKTYDVYKLAAQKMLEENYLIFDTETTGLSIDDEIVELGIIDCRGHVLYDGLFCPEKDVHWAAAKVSGLTKKKLSNEPLFKDEFEKIMRIMNGRPVIAFNENFDERLFCQTAGRYRLDRKLVERAFSRSFCCQHLYNEYLGFKGQTKLDIACAAEGVDSIQSHRAVGDCLMTLALLKVLADPDKTPNLRRYLKLKGEKPLNDTPAKESVSSEPQRPIRGDMPSYLSLFKENKTLEEIATIRGVKLSTVENHIIDLFLRGDVPSVDFMIDERYSADILKIAQDDAWNGRLRTIKEQVPTDCSYGCIRAVLAKSQKEQGVSFQKPDNRSLDKIISDASNARVRHAPAKTTENAKCNEVAGSDKEVQI